MQNVSQSVESGMQEAVNK